MMPTQAQIYDVVTQHIMFQTRTSYHFFKKIDNLLCNTSDFELLAAFLVPFIFNMGKLVGKCLTQTIVFGLSSKLSLEMPFIYPYCSFGSDGSRSTVTFSFSERL